MDFSTPIKTTYTLDLNATKHFCIICGQEKTASADRRRLYNDKEEKTSICEELQYLFQIEFNKLDLKIVCKNCLTQVRTVAKKVEEIKTKYKNTKSEIEEKYITSSKKRMSKGDSFTKKKLQMEEEGGIQKETLALSTIYLDNTLESNGKTEQSTNEQSTNEQFTNEQSTEEQSTNEQSTNKHCTEEQCTDEQSNQSTHGTDNQSTKEQCTGIQSINETGDQNLNKQCTGKYIEQNSSIEKDAMEHEDDEVLPFGDLAVDGECIDFASVSLKNGEEQEIWNIDPKLLKIVKLLLSSKFKSVVNALLKSYPDECQVVLEKYVKKTISFEAKSLSLSPSFNSNLKTSVKLKDFSFKRQYVEASKKAPLTLKLIEAIGVNPRINRNKVKSKESLKPSLLTSLNVLLNCRSWNCNQLASVNGLILKQGQADKSCINRMNALSLSVSYSTVITRQIQLGKDFLAPVQAWIDKSKADLDDYVGMIEGVEEIEDDIPIINDAMFKISLSNDPDASFLDDSAPNSTNARLLKTNEEIPPIEVHQDPNLYELLNRPSNLEEDIEENEYLMHYDSWEIDANSTIFQPIMPIRLIDFNLRFLTKFMYIGDNLDKKIGTRHFSKLNQNTMLNMFNVIAALNRVPTPAELFGVLANLPKTASDVVFDHYLPTKDDKSKLMQEITFLVSKDLVKYIDELSWAKSEIKNCINHPYMEYTTKRSTIFPLGIINANESSHEGMHEIMKEANTFVPGYSYNHQLKTFLIGDLKTVERAQNVQLEHSDSNTSSKRFEGLIPALADFHTYGNFLGATWKLLYDTTSAGDTGTLYQARNFLNSRGVKADPMKSVNDCEDLVLKYTEALILAAYEEVKREDPWLHEKMINEKKFKFFQEFVSKIVQKFVMPSSLDDDDNDESDSLRNYSTNALCLGYIIKDFLDARKFGDGERIIRLHKWFLLYFKITSKTKYAFQTVHLLAQINVLLPPALAHELMWNRSVNNRGFPSTNTELDRELEHKNKIAKKEFGNMEGKITEKSISRVSRCYQEVKDMIDSFDNEVQVSHSSGNHKKPSWKDDVIELSNLFEERQLFKHKEGRSHAKFPSFQQNLFKKIDTDKMKTWIETLVLKFSRWSIYRSRNIYA